jgi:hypothetical protein
MPNQTKISQLSNANTPLGDSDAIPIIQNISGNWQTRKATVANLRNVTLERLTANRTYYVRTDGNDNNNGLSNSPSGAFATIIKAIRQAYQLNWNGYNVTIQVANGTYNETITVSGLPVGAIGNLTITGNTSSPSSCVWTGSLIVRSGARFAIRGFQIGGGSAHALQATEFGYLLFENLIFASTPGYSHLFAQFGRLEASGDYSIDGGSCMNHMICQDGGTIRITGRTVTLLGNLTCSLAFAYCERASRMIAFGNTYNLGSYSVTGQRYQVLHNSVIQVNTTNQNYFPGSTAGTTDSGGQYV